MGSIDSVADQMLDRLAALVMGPAIGRVTVSGTAIVRGTVGVLPDKRLVRVRSPQRVVTGSQVDVRLHELAPTATAGAFVRVPAGTTVTWRAGDTPSLQTSASASIDRLRLNETVSGERFLEWQALRATSPPMLWPTITSSSSGTGH